jgi:hypothetical protein
MRRVLDWYLGHATGAWLAVAVVLGSLQAVYVRYSMNPDGIAYLDMGDAYLRGDWATAIRSHWSPLYAWLVAAALWLANPTPGLEFPFVHLVNLAIYCLALGAFTFLLREILATLHHIDVAAPAENGLPQWAWMSVGYAAFIWCTLQYMPLGLLTPDLLVSALVYAICGVMLRTRRLPRRRWSAVLGGLLGLGYLAKAPMLPLAVVFLATSVLIVGRRTSRMAHLAVASIVLAVVALPFAVVLSVANGRLTIGDSALHNYLWQIDGVSLVHWQGGPDGVGQPLHHSELLLDRPAIFAFDSPFPVTYAAWYAPEYWLQGATPVFMLGGQVRAIVASLEVTARLAGEWAIVFVPLAILLSMRSRPWRLGGEAPLALLAPALAALAMYVPVLVEARYVAPFLLILVLGLLMVVRLPKARWSAALTANVSLVMVMVLLLQIGSISAGLARSALSQVLHGRLLEADDQAQVAVALRSAGLGPGDAVASGNRAFNDYWARLARVRIVAEVSGRDGFTILDDDASARTAAQQILLAQHVRAVVAQGWPAQTGDAGWHPIEGTDYFYYLVPDRP